MNTTKTFVFTFALAFIALVALGSTPVFASSTGNQGQPNQSCQSVFPSGTFEPNGFNTAGFNHSTTVYAGSGQTLNTPANGAAVSQYDVACFQVAQH